MSGAARTGKSDLRAAARQARIQAMIHENQKSKLIPEDASLDYIISRYCLSQTVSYARCKRLQALSQDFGLSDEYDEDEFFDGFLNACDRGELVHMLRTCRSKGLWTINDDELEPLELVEHFLDLTFSMVTVENKPDHRQINFLSKEEAEHVIALACLFRKSSSDSEAAMKILWTCGGRNAFDILTTEMNKTLPQRGDMVYHTGNILTGKELFHNTSDVGWVNADDMRRFANAMAHIMMDSRTHPESNGWIYSTLDVLFELPQWVDVVYPITIEAMRSVAIRKQVQEDLGGDFDDLVFVASQTKGSSPAQLCRPIRSGGLIPEEQWAFYLSEFARDDRGFSKCECSPPNALNKCKFDIDISKISEFKRDIDELENYLIFSLDSKSVIARSTKLLADMFPLRRNSMLWNEWRNFECKVLFVRAKAYIGLGLYDDAVYDYQSIFKDEFTLSCDMIAWPNPGFNKISEASAKALYLQATALRDSGNVKEARLKASCLIKCGPSSDEETKVDDFDISEWHTKAKALITSLSPTDKPIEKLSISELKSSLDARGLSQLTHGLTEKEELAALLRDHLGEAQTDLLSSEEEQKPDEQSIAIVRSSGLVEAVTCFTERCSWKSAGDDFFDKGSNTQILMVPRLKWRLFWKNRELVVWDYGKERVIHWLTQKDAHGDFIETHRSMVLDMHLYHETGGALYIASNSSSFYCINLEMLIVGERTSMVDATNMLQQSLSFHDPGFCNENDIAKWAISLSKAMKSANCFSYHRTTENSWVLAVSQKPTCAVEIYRQSIKPDTTLGPFAVMTMVPDFELLGHEHIVYEARFACHPESSSLLLITSANDDLIKFWNIDNISENFGMCLNTIRKHPKMYRTYCMSKSLLFIAESQEKTWFDVNKLKDSSILVYSITSATLVGRLVSTNNRSNINALLIETSSSQLIALHDNGFLNVWRFDEDAYMQRESQLPTFRFSFCYHIFPSLQYSVDCNMILDSSVLYLSRNNIMYALYIDTLAGGFPSAIDGRYLAKGALGESAKVMNCLNCKHWKINSHALCSGCLKISFCDKDCQKASWRSHKKFCIETNSK